MVSERTAITRIDSASQKTIGSGVPAPIAAGPFAKPTIPDVELESEIGRGGMGVVYRGRQTYIDRRVAVKLLLVHGAAADEEYVRRFQREAKILAGLSHPHIVACYSAGVTTERQPYLVMEFIDGCNLKQWITEHGPLTQRDALRLTRELAQALGHAHANGIIHRDVKPENVLLAKREGDSDPFPFQAKLVDLGLARPQGAAGDMHLTGAGQIMGTPTTMAPEQFDDPEGVDFRADIYGLGCVLFHALTGRPAFDGNSLAQIVTAKISGVVPNPSAEIVGLSPDIGILVADMLAKDRANRPQSYEQLIARCHPLLGGKSLAARGSRLPWVVIGGVGVVAVGILALLVVPQLRVTKASEAPATMIPRVVNPAATIVAAVAPPTPTALIFGAPQLLWRSDVGNRLKDWTFSERAMWVSSESTDHGIAGVSGRISRKIEGASWTIAATLVPGNAPDAKTDEVSLGVLLPNGEALYVHVSNLGAAAQLMVERSYADPAAAPQVIMNGSIAPGALKLELVYAERFVRISYNGTPFEKAIGLSGDPIGMFLSTVGEAPVEVHDLTIRHPSAAKP